MTAASGIGITMPSGLDDNSIINELVALEQQNVTTVQTQVTKDQASVSAYSQISSLLSNVSTAGTALATSGSFDVFTSSSTNSDAVGISGSSGGLPGQYDVNVYNLASSEKMISAAGKITSQTASLSSLGINVGDINVDGVKITVQPTDTIQDLRSKINSAKQSDGTAIGVTASVVQMSATDYRLLLVSNDTGSDGIAYKDVSGSTLQNLGIISTADGEKGNVNQVLQTADDSTKDDLVTAWNNLAAGSAVQLKGTDHAGNDVSATFIKNSGDTLDDFLKKITAAYHGTVTATTDTNGHLVLTDAIAGTSDLAMSSLALGATNYATTITQGGENGAGVLNAGTNAYYSIEGMQMNSASNSVTGFVSGTTFTLNGIAANQPVTVGLTRNTGTIMQNVEALLNSYNSLMDYVNGETQLADPTNTNSQNGDLAGDMTAKSIVDQVDSLFQNDYSMLGGSLTSLAMLGVQTDPTTGHLSLDESTFNAAIDSNYQAVENLFTQVGTSSNSNIAFGRSTSDTQAGNYVLQEIDPTHVRIKLSNSNQWYTSDARAGDVVTFSSGPAKGLSITAPAGMIGDSSTFTYSNGLAADMNNLITSFSDPISGLVQLQTSTIQQKIQDENTQITTLQDQVDQYRTRLVNEFSQMETLMSSLKQQSSRISSTYGITAS